MDLEKVVFVEPSAALNGVLRFQSGCAEFKSQTDEILDRFSTLRSISKVVELDRLVRSLGLDYHYVGSAQDRLEFLKRVVTEEFVCDVPFLESNELFGFQHIGVNLAVSPEVPNMVLQWDTGAGKTVGASLAAQHLFDTDQIDLALFFVKRNKLIDWDTFLRTQTRIEPQIAWGGRQWRHDLYKQDINCFVLNYERAREGSKPKRKKPRTYNRTDLLQLLELVEGKRVLFVFDEAQKLRNESLTTLGIRRLIGSVQERRTLALSATPLVTNPGNYWSLFRTIEPDIPKVSGEWSEFDEEYVAESKETRFGYLVTKWQNLDLLGKRIEPFSHVAMKSDPEIASQFPEMVEKIIHLDLSDHDRSIYRRLLTQAKEEFEENKYTANQANLQALRVVCNTSEALLASNGRLVTSLLDGHVIERDECKLEYSEKFSIVAGLVEDILNRDEKVVLFTRWTNGTLFQYLRGLREMGATVHPYYGVGMSDAEKQRSIETFNASSSGCVFLASDAGQDGLNLYAPYLIHVDTPYTFTEYKQRRDRIHRSDSHRHGIHTTWSYRFITSDSVETRVEDRMLGRRSQAQEVAGVTDTLVTEDSMTSAVLRYLMFGE